MPQPLVPTADTTWTPQEQTLVPVMTAIMCRILPSIMVLGGAVEASDTVAVHRLLDTADAILLSTMEECSIFSAGRRRLYWKALHTAMREDKAIIHRSPVPPHQS
ncbi:MAG: hypothetical protein JNJ83_00120 [Verrucomicrobiaceae bacterium]|nr:hypothetical protein [Verrucomicrobiaceae bacterium]